MSGLVYAGIVKRKNGIVQYVHISPEFGAVFLWINVTVPVARLYVFRQLANVTKGFALHDKVVIPVAYRSNALLLIVSQYVLQVKSEIARVV